MEEKVYIVTSLFSGFPRSSEEEHNIEKVFSNKEDAERFAASMEKEYETAYTIVPEEIFNRWPMDDICNSPVPEFKGYSYDDFQAQLEHLHEFRTDFISCTVEERPVYHTAITFSK